MMPLDPAERRLIGKWLLLVALTLLSVEGLRRVAGGAALAVAVLVIAFIKVRMIALDFMEVRGAPLALRLVVEAYVVVVCATLLVIVVGTSGSA